MAAAITKKRMPGALRFTLGPALEVTAVTVPDITGAISFNPSGDIILAFEDETDGDPLASTNYVTIPGGEWTHFKWAALDKRNTGRNTFYIAGPAGGEIVELLAQD